MISGETALLQTVFGCMATGGFGVLFNVPRKLIPLVALLGGCGTLLRYTLQNIGVSLEVATFFAALTIGLLGYMTARRLSMPRLIFTVTGIIPLIPGVRAYQVLLLFSQGNVLGGLENAVRATLITGAIALGLSGARLITDLDKQLAHD